METVIDLTEPLVVSVMSYIEKRIIVLKDHNLSVLEEPIVVLQITNDINSVVLSHILVAIQKVYNLKLFCYLVDKDADSLFSVSHKTKFHYLTKDELQALLDEFDINFLGVMVGTNFTDYKQKFITQLLTSGTISSIPQLEDEESMIVPLLYPLISHSKSDIISFATKHEIPYQVVLNEFQDSVLPLLENVLGFSIDDKVKSLSKELNDIKCLIDLHVVKHFIRNFVSFDKDKIIVPYKYEPITFWKYLLNDLMIQRNMPPLPEKIIKKIFTYIKLSPKGKVVKHNDIKIHFQTSVFEIIVPL